MFSFHTTVNYREAYGLHASNGVLFKHEAERRGETFVTQKNTRAVAAIHADKQEHLYLDAKRDWGFAGDYVEATGAAHTVREFCELAFAHVGLDWEPYVRVDERDLRPSEVDHRLGDASKAHAPLGWEPTVSFPQLVARMVDADCGEPTAGAHG